MKPIKFTVLGHPTAKGRARFTRQGIAYKDKQTSSYENLVRLSFISANPYYEMIDQNIPLKAKIKAYYYIPKSYTKKKRLEIEKGLARPMKKPDLDNIAKIILDSLNGVAYIDDKQIVELEIKKYYSEQPRVEVEIGRV